MNLHHHLLRQIAFSRKTFGPGQRTKGIIDHIRKELVELEASDGAADEWVDVVILALDGLTREFAATETSDWHVANQACEAILAKQSANERRTWPDWRRKSQDEAIEHERGDTEQKPGGQSGYVEYDGFSGTVQGHYVTREGKRGLVLQQHGTKVVHVYREDRVVLDSAISGDNACCLKPDGVKALVEFFRTEGYSRFGYEGDVEGWSPAETAINAMRKLEAAESSAAALQSEVERLREALDKIVWINMENSTCMITAKSIALRALSEKE